MENIKQMPAAIFDHLLQLFGKRAFLDLP